MRPAGHCLVEALIEQGVDTVFGVPGESFLAALDGFYEHRDRIRFIACRQEGGAAYMADAQGKLSGRPGVGFVTRGPGASNAAVGLHTAFQDKYADGPVHRPGRLAISAIARLSRRSTTARCSARARSASRSGVGETKDADRLPEYVARAWRTEQVQEPCVLVNPKDPSKLILFYSGVPSQNKAIAAVGKAWAEVRDPFRWHEYEANPVFGRSATGWDSGTIRLDAVLYIPEEDAYYIYYSGTKGKIQDRIGLAICPAGPDGYTTISPENMRRYGDAPVLAPEPDAPFFETMRSLAAVLREWTRRPGDGIGSCIIRIAERTAFSPAYDWQPHVTGKKLDASLPSQRPPRYGPSLRLRARGLL